MLFCLPHLFPNKKPKAGMKRPKPVRCCCKGQEALLAKRRGVFMQLEQGARQTKNSGAIWAELVL